MPSAGSGSAALQEFIALKEEFDRRIEQTKTRERSQAIEKARALVDKYGLSAADLGTRAASKGAKKAAGGAKVAAKYCNASTGTSWSGRGLQPRWLKAAIAGGRKIGHFAV